MRRQAIGIWKCKGCKVSYAGGAYELSTTVATTAKITMARLNKLIENANKPAEVVEEKKEVKGAKDAKEPRDKKVKERPAKEGKEAKESKAERPAEKKDKKPEPVAAEKKATKK